MEKNYDDLKKFQVVKFQDRLSYVFSKLKENGINITIPQLKPFHIEVTDEIREPQMKDAILENIKSAYSPNTNTIYFHESFINAPQFEYHFTKRMLEHLSTTIEDGKILSGVSISNGNTTYNKALNQAIIESTTNTLLGNDTIDEDTYKNYIIERHHLSLIQNIVGLETILNSFFNSDYLMLESKFEFYGTKLQPIVEQMDTLEKINYDHSYSPKEKDNNLASEIFTKILDAYTRKAAKTGSISNKEDFENHIINPETVRGAFGNKDKLGYEGVNRNIQVFKTVLSGLENAQNLSLKQTEVIRSIR